MGLTQTCVSVNSGKPYIVSLHGGDNVNTEGLSKNFNWAFVSEFANAEDLKYYVETDPAHAEAKALMKDVVKDVFVYDIEY